MAEAASGSRSGNEDSAVRPHPVHMDDAEPSGSGEEAEPLDAVEEPAESGARPPSRIAREMLAMFGQWGPAPHPLADKMSTEHITAMLEIDRERVTSQRDGEKHARIIHALMFGGFCLFVLLLVALLLWAGNDELTEKILIGLVSAVASGFGGYGIGRSQKD